MAYKFKIHNSTAADVVVKIYDWNDSTHGISYGENHTLSANDTVTINALNEVVRQISLFKKDGTALMNEKQMNFYSMKRNWKIIEKGGNWNIMKADGKDAFC